MATRQALKLIRGARRGDAATQLALGCLYLQGGEGFSKNLGSAYLWLSRAAEGGQAAAWRLIGECIPPQATNDPVSAMRWYQKAATEGCVPAQRKLARLLLAHPAIADETGSAANTPQQLLRAAALGGDAEAQLELGRGILSGLFAPLDEEEALSWLERAFSAGNIAAARVSADHFWKSGDSARARLWYARCGDLGDTEVCYRYGLLSAVLGVPGAEWLERAARAGHAGACEELAIRYAMGCHRASKMRPETSRRLKQAARWLEHAANLGSAKACFILHTLFKNSGWEFRDPAAARRWLFEAARRGYAEAQYKASLFLWRQAQLCMPIPLHESGQVEADVQAIRWLSDAASQGHEEASRFLARVARRAASPSDATAAQYEEKIAAIARRSKPIAMRIELAMVLGLRRHEMLLAHPLAGDRGNCFVIDMCLAHRKARRQIILVDRPEQREVIQRAKRLFGVADPLPGDVQGTYRARYQKFWDLCRRAGIDWRVFDFGILDVPSISSTGMGTSLPLEPAEARSAPEA